MTPSWNEILYTLLFMLMFNVFATVVLMLSMFVYPKYLIFTYHRVMVYWRGMSKKKIMMRRNFSFSYVERGEPDPASPSLLLVHGYSSSKESWLEFTKYLPEEMHIVAVDLPGHGETTRQEKVDCSVMSFVNHLKEFVEEIGLGQHKFHLLGISLGGHISGLYASEYPDDLTSLTLFCPHGIKFEKEQRMREEHDRTGKIVMLPETDSEFEQMIDFLTHKKIQIPKAFISGTMQLRREANWFYRKVLEALVSPDNAHLLENNLHKINTPLMLLWGKEDQCLDVECVETIKQKLPVPPKSVIVLDNVGHCVHLERPRKCAYAVLEILNTFA